MGGAIGTAGFSIFEYMYRDAGNFKTHGQLLLAGASDEAEAAIRGCLEWGDEFVAEQVRVPSLCGEHWEAAGEGPSELDHAFHEFVGLRAVSAGEAKHPPCGSLEALVARMRAAAGRWDVSLSPNCEL